MRDLIEQPRPRRDDGRVDDEEVFVDQARYVGQRPERLGTEGGDDVGPVLLLELLQDRDGVTRPHLTPRVRIIGEIVREHQLPHRPQDAGELEAGGALEDVGVGGGPRGHLLPVGHHELVQLARHDPGVRVGIRLVDVGRLFLAPRERLPERSVRLADPAVQRGLHDDDDLAHTTSPSWCWWWPADVGGHQERLDGWRRHRR